MWKEVDHVALSFFQALFPFICHEHLYALLLGCLVIDGED